MINGSELQQFGYASRLEWLETNGLGGYAFGTVAGVNTRKYHGLLVAALKPPVDRRILVSHMDETIVAGEQRYELACHQFPGAVHPQGYQYLQSFDKNFFPEFIYKAGDVELRKTIIAVHGENTTLVLYEVLSAPAKFTLELQAFYACHDIHHLAKANQQIGQPYIFDQSVLRTMNYHGCPEIFISVPKSNFTEEKGWYHNFEYLQEFERGMEFTEDLYTHGKFSVTLKQGSKLGVIVSTEDPAGRDAFMLCREEKKRREILSKPFSGDDTLKRLALAADQFIVKRGELNTIVAGYPWFTDWGRDTMISLPGLCLVTGRYKDARKILQAFADHVVDGMLPNRFPDTGEEPEYNTIDATLWFFYAIHKYYEYTRDKNFIASLIPVLKEIIDWHYKGTRYNIQVDAADELLSGGENGVQLTWMDAKVGDWVVTPRTGKAVEINALWYNALCVMEKFMKLARNNAEAQFYKEKAHRVNESFNVKFWNEEFECLYDFIDGDIRNNEVRPNQLYAISLPFPVLEKGKAKKVLDAVTKNLLTPRGLRSLAPRSRDYIGTYSGNILARDGAYHQGTVWSYLIGPYIDALFYISSSAAKEQAVSAVHNIFSHLDEGCIGSVSEIFDGDAPHTPRGCVAQAWSIAELLRVSVEHNLFGYIPKTEKAKVLS